MNFLPAPVQGAKHEVPLQGVLLAPGEPLMSLPEEDAIVDSSQLIPQPEQARGKMGIVYNEAGFTVEERLAD